ncbi:hypothetical protein [Cystobacter ferrugineus]|uniref:Lipoprotein n=1 Tax=Cystobacter ferrugineus TaxID=83449 RepID=A0A1L9ATR4_9BACT|nr:hypothetical protein [Cystobacter ferrugineus]OJH33391.1 hypothetical protein BON30_48985 [Cystobacter ferrugineus]
MRSARPSPGLFAALFLVLLCPLACASNTPPPAYASTRNALADLDEFGALLVKAGLPAELLPTDRDLSAEQARQLRLHFHLFPPKASEYAPWLVADVLLLDVTRKNEVVPRVELSRRVQEFQPLVVLRPDGYLASALSGKEQQCVGPVEVQDGAYRAGVFEVGTFYKKDEAGAWQSVVVPAPSTSR